MTSFVKPATSGVMTQQSIAILAGGVSAEREVSLASGAAVHAACETLGLQAQLLDVQEDIAAQLVAIKPDVAFIALHGTMGEDGAMQGLLEWLRIPYTHSFLPACALAMDKHRAKKMVALAGVPVLEDQLVQHTAEITLPLPFVVKPVADGSSVGVHLMRTAAERKALPARFDALMLAEPLLEGKELTAGVLGKDVLDVIEICPKNAFYDYVHKYTAGMTDYVLPAEIPAAVTQAIQAHTLAAHQALGCKDISRSDFLYHPQTGQLAYLETNTHPGLTATSLFPKMAAHRGMDFTQLVQYLLEHAALQHASVG